ncbi:nucleoside-diphosphate sugar epimerase/dehydratase [Salisediminibacterium beveridgei]|uniref:UDP-N-acetylglucosamine 4,6-dehydratase n=1 Tax=Salisediminibacterium beveridgei TaxID=632773 RepID=A0A1D7QRP2_9BACI|nr:nucleoside-diphosphate sugar epimerase/dehydratase [Salisediminibacterium beveridgei]AOM81676.1 UDP-N-acetylglucosamine 4,6-dehydratase [Salisediminibacterium beveridgei]
MSQSKRKVFLGLVDSIIVLSAIFISYYLVVTNTDRLPEAILASSVVLLISHHIFAHFFNLYNRIWEYASVGELTAIIKAVSLSVIPVYMMQMMVFDVTYNRAMLVTWMLHILLIGGSRFSWRIFRDEFIQQSDMKQKRTLIIGAGKAGSMVARQLQQSEMSELKPVSFVDDDPQKINLEIMGIPVLGKIDSLHQIVNDYMIEHIVIAIPSLPRAELNGIFLTCATTKVRTQIMPAVEDIMSGKVSVMQMRDVQVEDLLGRDPVELDNQSIGKKLTGRRVMITGAGGSIGSEVCRQVSLFHPDTVILLGHGENSIYAIDMELRNQFGHITYEAVIADVQDEERINDVISTYSPDVIYHAAAHKHVPLMEKNPHEAIKNNVMGTLNVSKAADRHGVSSFVMVSTDKAVKPTSVMGATKRIAEMVVQHMDTVSDTKFVAVRFGNVLGSRGSVIPLFKQQIENGGPVTVTHPEMTRYFMTIPEASRLVVQAGAIADGGETFVLDMGKPVKIVDLAKNLIRLSGFTEDEIEIRYTGMRPGEKLFEELLGEDEVHGEQIYPMIYRGKTPPVNIQVINELIEEFDAMSTQKLRVSVLDIAHFRTKQLRAVGSK